MNASAGASLEAIVSGFTTGLVGDVGVRLLDNAGGTTTARTTSGIGEYPTGSGVYYASITAPSVPGQYTIMWDNGSATPGNIAVENLVIT